MHVNSDLFLLNENLFPPHFSIIKIITTPFPSLASKNKRKYNNILLKVNKNVEKMCFFLENIFFLFFYSKTVSRRQNKKIQDFVTI